MHADPFGTADIRRRVLEAWAATPERFREDANAEEDLVRGGYRDRLLVELAQNAADAARRAGRPGHLRLDLAGDVLHAANTGAPLDDAGVRGLASLRASGKRDQPDAVGRFGVGFAAVLAVSEEPEIRSVSGGIRFSASATRAEVAPIRSPPRSSCPCGRAPGTSSSRCWTHCAPTCCSRCRGWSGSTSSWTV
jgi:hypothetical protein